VTLVWVNGMVKIQLRYCNLGCGDAVLGWLSSMPGNREEEEFPAVQQGDFWSVVAMKGTTMEWGGSSNVVKVEGIWYWERGSSNTVISHSLCRQKGAL